MSQYVRYPASGPSLPLSIANGGTGLSALGTANQLIGANNADTALEYKSLLGTTDQLTVTHAANSITLSLPQSINTTSSPSFSGLTLLASGALNMTTSGSNINLGSATEYTINTINWNSTGTNKGSISWNNGNVAGASRIEYVASTASTGQQSGSHNFNVDGNTIVQIYNNHANNDREVIFSSSIQFNSNNARDIGVYDGAGTATGMPRNIYAGTGISAGTSTLLPSNTVANFVSTSKGVIFPNITSAPTSPVAGMVVFDTNNSTGAGTNKLVCYDGSAWNALF